MEQVPAAKDQGQAKDADVAAAARDAAKVKDGVPDAVKVAAPVKAAQRARGADKGSSRLPKTKTSSPKRHASLS
jgi:hypothetical protein